MRLYQTLRGKARSTRWEIEHAAEQGKADRRLDDSRKLVNTVARSYPFKYFYCCILSVAFLLSWLSLDYNKTR